ncbi:sulfatase-like hydrolase/transferase [Galbibacter mesophilus]|uniref:sulfatase-like hydrolase/transferase n=1 Tax=Galbibacter mesophilus TaxID=379069 RepID=UPI00192000B1|nr:sulfatase-like hydrolase/transferase [Galbibacter mesophilus]MCM5663260.1 sulfatase-like hydrolase/transferase [Galbibacter mesophilus]
MSAILVSCAKKDSAAQLNVIYISMEDMMPSFGCYEDTIAYTPNIDKFSEDAIIFKDAHCQVALCTPSRTSILTGIRPSTSGIVKIDDDWQKMLPHATSLPRHFRNSGYHTVIAGKIHDYRSGETDDAYSKVFDIHGIDDNDLAFKAIDNAINQKKPFFLALGYSQTHDPWTPDPKSESHYSLNQFSSKDRHPYYKGELLDSTDIKNLQKKYYGEITEVDSLIGEILARIKQLELHKNSVILLGAMDHGYSFGNHSHWGKGNNYDDETRVPLLISTPGCKNLAIEALIELVDIYPTLIELCGLPNPPQSLEGISFVPLLRSKNKEWKKAVFTHRAYNKDIVGVKTKKYTFIDFEGDSVELYNRISDALNRKNIANEFPEVVSEMKILKEKGWRNAMPKENQPN